MKTSSMPNSRQGHPYWLLAAVTLEVIAQTYGPYLGLPILSSVIYFLAGLAVAVLPMWHWQIPAGAFPGKWPKAVALVVLCFLVVWCLWRSALLFEAVPLNYRQADMLPIIETMAERWWSGEVIYAPIEAIWGGMRPIYLPAMWLPYVLPVGLGFDIRWLSTAALLISALLIYSTGVKRDGNEKTAIHRLLGLLPMILLFYFIFGLYSTLLTLSEEPIVVFYYTFLAWALYRKKPMPGGLAMALCLLSRYALAFWVPMFLLYLFFFRSRREAYQTLASLLIALVLLLSLGKAWEQIGFFLQLQNSYLDELLDPAKSWSFIAQIEKNPGLIKFLPFEHIDIWHRLLLVGSLLVPAFSFFVYKKFRTRLDGHFFGLCSLKLSLVFFYNMLTIPYSYLFYPSTVLSLFLLFATFSGKRS